MRSAMRTVEKRCEMNSAILPVGEFGEALEHFELAARIEGSSGLVENQQLRVAQVSPGQGELLPFAARKIDAGFETPAQASVRIAKGSLAITSSARLFERPASISQVLQSLRCAHGDVFAGSHLVAHEILKDHADLAIQIVEVVFAKIDPIEQDLSFGGIVESGDQFDDGGFAFAVLADQRDSLARLKREVQVAQERRSLPG